MPKGPFAIDPHHPTPLLGLLPEWPYPTLCPLSPLPNPPPTAAYDSTPMSPADSPQPVLGPAAQQNGSHAQEQLLCGEEPRLPHQGAPPVPQGQPVGIPLESAWERQQPVCDVVHASPDSPPAAAGAQQSLRWSGSMQPDALAGPVLAEPGALPERAPEGQLPAELPQGQAPGSSTGRGDRMRSKIIGLPHPDDAQAARKSAADEEARQHEQRSSQDGGRAAKDGSREPAGDDGRRSRRDRLLSPDEEELNRRRVRRRPRGEHPHDHSRSTSAEDERRRLSGSWDGGRASGSRSREPAGHERERRERPQLSRAGREAHSREDLGGSSKGAGVYELDEAQARRRDTDRGKAWPFEEGRILACRRAAPTLPPCWMASVLHCLAAYGYPALP